MLETVPNEKPKWHQIRWQVSNWLVKLAREIYPQSPQVLAFWKDVMMDQMIQGGTIVRIDQKEYSL